MMYFLGIAQSLVAVYKPTYIAHITHTATESNPTMSKPATEPSTASLAQYIWGEENLQRRIEVLKELEHHPVLSANVNLAGLSRRDHWAVRAQQAQALVDLYFRKGWSREHFLTSNRILGDLPSAPQFRSGSSTVVIIIASITLTALSTRSLH
jgi:hypothetical protein